MIERATAVKLNIKEIKSSEWVEKKPIINKREVIRARVIGTIIQKYIASDNNYGFIVVDDETENIRVKAFKEEIELIKKTEKGDFVDIIGKIRKYEDEIYISPEIIYVIKDPNFYYLRKIEMMKPKKEEKMSIEGKREEILERISKINEGNGASFDEIEKALNMKKEDVEAVLYNLLKDGFIYEPKHRTYKVL